MTKKRSGKRGGGQNSGGRYENRRDNSFSGNKRGRNNWERNGRNEGNGGNFHKFTGTNSMSPRRHKSSQHNNYNSQQQNNHKFWAHNKKSVDNHYQSGTSGQNEYQKDNQEEYYSYNKPVASSEQQVQKTEPLRTSFKSKKPDLTPKSPKSKPSQPSISEHERETEREDIPKTNDAEVSNPLPKIKIKQEQTDSVRPEIREFNKAPPASRPTASPSSSESSSSDSSSSSSSEDEEPPMPQPLKGGDVKPKKEKKSEDDVVFLGKMNKIENLADSDDFSACIICNKPGHSSDDCQMKCRKCSHSSYQRQMVCRTCGETYMDGGIKSAIKPPNPFVAFMQFMQFCMSQYSAIFADVEFPCHPCESTIQCAEMPPTAEVSRKDIENSKTNRKRTKSETKQKKKVRKNCQPSTDDESDSDSIAASSSKRRKKRHKSITRETETPPAIAQQQKPFGQYFGQSYPANHPFAGSFNSIGFNPMLAFSQMMGYNPAAMNFTK